MTLDLAELFIAEFLRQHREEPREALGPEVTGMLIRDGPQPSEQAHEQLQHPHRPVQDRVRRIPEQAEILLLLAYDCLYRDVVDLPDDGGWARQSARTCWRYTIASASVRLARTAFSPTSRDRKSTRLNSSHVEKSYAVF